MRNGQQISQDRKRVWTPAVLERIVHPGIYAEKRSRKITLHTGGGIRILAPIDKESQTTPVQARAFMRLYDGAFYCRGVRAFGGRHGGRFRGTRLWIEALMA